MNSAAPFVALTCIMLTIVLFWYVPLIVKRRVQPYPAAWVIFAVTMNSAGLAYWHTPGATVAANIALYAAAMEINVVLTALLITLYRNEGIFLAFTGFQQFTLLVTAAVMANWYFHRDDADIAYATIQGLLITGYLLNIGSLVQRQSAFDSIGNWGLICLASFFGLFPAFMKEDVYAELNAVRGFLFSGATLALLLWLDSRNSWQRWLDEVSTLRSVYGLGRN